MDALKNFIIFAGDVNVDDVSAYKEVVEYYEEHNIKEKAKALTTEYEEKYGPLTSCDMYGDSSWKWIHDPWPWEKQENDA